jgi:hypothetical protein
MVINFKTGHHYIPGRCFECRAEEHNDYDNDIRVCSVKNGHNKHIIKKVRLCKTHREDGKFLWQGLIIEVTNNV